MKIDTISIPNKAALMDAVQDYLALVLIKKQVESATKKLGDTIKSKLRQFNHSLGPLPDYDGPNGGITYSEQPNREFNAEAVKKHFGEAIANMMTELVVRSEFRDAVMQMIALQLKAGVITEEDANEIVSEADPTPKLISVFGRRPEGTSPQIPYNPTSTGEYQPLSPRLMKELNLEEFVASEEAE